MSQKKKLAIIIGSIIMMTLLVVVGLLVSARGQDAKMQEHLDLGAQYLDELDYERAIAEYTAVLSIDPKCVDAYLGIVDAYIGMGDYENALLKAQEGYDETRDERLSRKVEEVTLFMEPVPTATPVPTVAPTPEPTEMPTPTPEPAVELLDGTEECEIIVQDSYNVINGNGGVIITEKDGLYGAVNYDGKELVPNSYTGYLSVPTNNGYFALMQGNGSESKTHVFGAAGNEWLYIENLHRLEIVGNRAFYSTYKQADGNTTSHLTLVDLTQGTALFSRNEVVGADAPSAYTPVVSDDGKFYFTDYYRDEFNELKVEESGNNNIELVEIVCDEVWSNFSDGYAMTTVMDFYREYMENPSGMVSKDRKEGCDFDLSKLWGESADFVHYFDKGLVKYNKGKVFVATDGASQYLFNMAKAKVNTYGNVQNLQETIVANYDSITLSDSSYYLVSEAGKHFYIDATGQVVHDSFLDYSSFYSGYAMIIDEDGRAYMIDEEFNKIAGGYEAESVTTLGGIFCVQMQDKKVYLAPPTE